MHDHALLNPGLSSLTHTSKPHLQAIQQEMEDGLDKKGDGKDFEERLAEQLFADEGDGQKIQVRYCYQCIIVIRVSYAYIHACMHVCVCWYI